MAFLVISVAALAAVGSNWMIKKNQVKGGTSFALMGVCFGVAALFSLGFIRGGWHAGLFVSGLVTGGLLFLMMNGLANALKYGPSGLTFAVHNSGSVLPAFFLYFIFGAPFDYVLTVPLVLGLMCVVGGLVWSAIGSTQMGTPFLWKEWLTLILGAFLLQGIILSIYQWKSLLFTHFDQSHPLLFLECEACSEGWFMPGLFLSSSLLNFLLLFFKGGSLSRSEFSCGLWAGVFNVVITFCLLLAPGLAEGIQKSLIFPFFTLLVISLSAAMGQFLYREKVNWMAIALCLLGVLLANL